MSSTSTSWELPAPSSFGDKYSYPLSDDLPSSSSYGAMGFGQASAPRNTANPPMVSTGSSESGGASPKFFANVHTVESLALGKAPEDPVINVMDELD